MLVKQSYADRLDSVGLMDDVHDEFAVLDRAGRVQLPREFLDRIGVSGNKVKLELVDGKIVVSSGDE